MSSQSLPVIAVRGEIKLGQFLKLAGLVEDGAEARVAVQSGDVLVNGEPESRRGHRLADGDIVVVDLPAGEAGAVVRLVAEA
ncbi:MULTISPECIES: RNA-binding S4 domain-containing protein [unclassified Actinomyces]|uniref:RNA-binding S4 domain-containing protein n=1 Tax=unclassified Actinomyces TaxID=2609248 RepID=UPI002016CEC2|nr:MULTISPECIES: RNA-binding S4 domain-containing protein [unclassified Actinomyces]MCL3778236.1 RNA-binding S4 domain-containing protein [Actinomyces sp. AC-20-1]MCL3789139.1 RNA-binding S4 domain-containing protein [Actinomyces sp. 187325]MCL3791494.1 RNA-binding S4 domain-containing protein [Actinomyces sp. 186855]MCL3794084.1 RNA-binding S4 domain-containing protein [Actinomyces sp. 217892]